MDISKELIVTADELPGELSDVAAVIGVENTLKLAQEYRGSSVYFHNVDSLLRKKRNNSIIEESDNGASVKTLARKYRLSIRQIMTILNSPQK